MNGAISPPQIAAVERIAVTIRGAVPSTLTIARRDVDHYRALQSAIFRYADPQSASECLLAINMAELSSETQRYRILRHRLLNTYRTKAVEMTLHRVD
ncbi:hypothetical protein ACNJYD_12915 [Bradyrhizobium sp. DASA03005]|uniref:hypothetical protein n=1 Tax=Bradyrhizobium TaxID=374 RepID=UPI00155F24E7|nr:MULTISPECIES: hypothetical protein [Bradyrhizobium]MDD1518407.1 hypothetical protein [Bradyrhizobium sp. WBAH30]MDD1542205.1 hypothetical protein [Bradyrhizobium sp. WBAH41]MDD1556357.1 hypothetical protein [Bradyrhizobium sp. WBAH23]MDD1561802.1 hypothetical protein [Bradyrhizobium sp. WBAH33]MDD1589176.1 hypothetical protein [Bradyrhizobium sp. WBAH42]